MKRIVIIFIFILLIVSVVGYRYFANNDVLSSTKDHESKVVSKELLENVETYQNVPIDKEWVVQFNDEVSEENLTVKVTDINNKDISVKVELNEKNDSVSIKAPTGGYEKGAYYELFIDPVQYANGDDYPETFKMAFITEREKTEKAKISDDLIYIDDNSLLSSDEKTSIATVSKTEDLTIKEEDIVVLPIRDGKAVQITSISEKRDRYEITYEEPQFGEVVESLDIYNTYSFFDDAAQFEPAEGIDVERVSKVSQDTGLASNQSKTIFAGENFTVTEGGDGSKKIETEASEEPLMHFEVSKELLKDKVISSLSLYITEPELLLDYKRNWFSIERLNAEVRTDLNIVGNLNYEFAFDKSKSNKKKLDKLSGEISLGTINYPVGPTGLLIGLDLALAYKIEADGSITGEFIATSNMGSKVSLTKPNKDADYSLAFDVNKDLDLGHTSNADGHFLLTAGMEPQIGVSVLEVVGLGVESYVGPYIEGTADLENETTIGSSGSANITVSEDGSTSKSGEVTSDKLNVKNAFCGELTLGVLGNVNIAVDTLKNKPLIEYSTGEKKWEHGRLSTCDQLTDLVVKVKEDLTNLKPGSKIPLQIYAEGKNVHTGKKVTERFQTKEDFDKLQFTISDKTVADIEIRKNKKGIYTAYLLTHEDLENYKTAVTISYTDEATELEKAFRIGADKMLYKEIQIAIEGEKVPTLSKAQAVNLLNKTLGTIRGILDDYTYKEGGGFAFSGEPDYVFLKKSISPYVTESFFDNNIDLLDDWFQYLETDAVRHFPQFNEDIRFILEQNKKNAHIETIWIANDLHQIGDALEFELTYIEGSWKLGNIIWKSISESPLTKQEALMAANQFENGKIRYKFNKETLVDGEKCYEFIDIDNSSATVNPVTSYVLYKSSETEPVNTATSDPYSEGCPDPDQVDSVDTLINNYSKPHITKSLGLNNKNYYSKHVSSIEAYLKSIEDIVDGSGMGSYLYNCTSYTLWDDLLGEVWNDLEKNLDSSSFQTLKSEQLNWISNKEAESKKSEAEGGVYMWPAAFYYETALMMTEERCKELISIYMK